MIRKNQKTIRILNYCSDSLLIFISYFVSVYIKYIVIDARDVTWDASFSFLTGIVFYCLLIPAAYYAFRVYAQNRLQDESGEYVTIILVNLAGTFAVAAVFYVLRITEFSRVALFFFWLISTVLVIGKHFFGRRIVSHYRVLGYNLRHIIVVGTGVHAYKYIEDIKKEKRLGIDVIGYVSNSECSAQGNHLGSYDDIEQIIEKYDPDEVIIALEPEEMSFMSSIINAAGKEGTHLSLIPFYNDYIPPHPEIESFGSTRLINLRATPMDSAVGAFLKRFVDIIVSLLMLIILSPLMIFSVIGVKFSSPGPIFFCQQRVGKDKKIFNMYKFRSMRVNAEEATAWSTNNDPRKTPFGSFIRKFSIDELPQLINVLKGDMSLVGPRPEIPFYVNQFKETVPFYLVRQQVRPGITGWAQVHGLRGDTSIEARVEYDIWYIQNWSLWLDMKIMFMTIFKGQFMNEEVIKK